MQPCLLSLNPWYWRRFVGGEPSEGVAVLVMAGVSILGVVLPAAALAWLILVSMRRWHARRLVRVSSLLLPLVAILFVVGGRVRVLCGLDPPYAFFWVGLTLELVALVMPLAILVWVCGAVVARRRSAGGWRAA